MIPTAQAGCETMTMWLPATPSGHSGWSLYKQALADQLTGRQPPPAKRHWTVNRKQIS
jgi:hypothetical protein